MKFAVRRFSYRTGISNDLVVSASMGWSAKQPQSHLEHFQAIKSKARVRQYRLEYLQRCSRYRPCLQAS